ncbi:antiviral reverse transcriptase Drt3a [Agrobacterium tumefaciens]|uniref:antiviral reverse transcriptase Drt3a n=1 Tax=Agrobacterium tumefaciens TaxID=358 RepID=UPI003BA0BE2C
MLDQGFNAKNFRRIYDVENRKGTNLDERFCDNYAEFAELKRLTASIKDCKTAVVNSKATLRADQSQESRDNLAAMQAELEDAIVAKDTYLTIYLTQLSENLARDGHTISLTARNIPGGKTLYVSNDDPTTFFIEKQIQYNISRLYKIRPASRDLIIPQIKSFCGGKLPIWGIRTDISDFYESVDHRKIIKHLKSDQLLDAPSIRYIQQILFSYSDLTANAVGLPRGNGISAYLSELYMRPVDTAIKGLDNILYYGRYVDDIVVLTVQDTSFTAADRLNQVSDVASDHGLALNNLKTTQFQNINPAHNRFDYLGYEFTLNDGKCNVDISNNKRDKYQRRIVRCFDVYLRAPARKRKKAEKLLFERVRFMTSNTKLFNNKSNAYIGVYYSNRHVTDMRKFTALDHALRNQIRRVASVRLQARLSSCSFVSGFSEQNFNYLNQDEFAQIIRLWKYE